MTTTASPSPEGGTKAASRAGDIDDWGEEKRRNEQSE